MIFIGTEINSIATFSSFDYVDVDKISELFPDGSAGQLSSPRKLSHMN